MPAPVSAAALIERLERTSLAEARALRGRIERARARPHGEAWARLAAEVEASLARWAARAATRPAVAYPPELPVSQRAPEIAEAIRAHPVVIVCGETGSGKTTQLPKVCLAAGRAARGLIGHTQPRRIAARTVAARIAQELGTSIGAAVGYKVRFSDRTRPEGFVKVMTDGILLAETQSDRLLEAYDTIIVDEAHERSLNIDFLLGFLARLLPRRPDLRVVVTSATLDAGRFSRHFGGAPVIEVSGRTWPVEVRYRPLESDEDDERDLEEAIVEAVDECRREGPGDVLVFLPGEREIRETAELLRRHGPAGTEILPLYARLAAAEQQRVFEPSGSRRVVLATNVAETSLTVPGIRYVVDPGLARVARYSVRNKVQMLQIERVSRAAADQRAGRCGRVAAGVCVRLYGEEDYAARPQWTEPEILRSSLAAVILRMAALDIGRVEDFPFLDPPAPRAIVDGYRLLRELGAVDESRRITALGRDLARLPVDPRVGRMILAARALGVLHEVLIIGAGLCVPDPRERPLARAAAADQVHERFRDARSDFLSFLHLWDFFRETVSRERSHRRQVAVCREHFLSWLRLREWRDIHGQLLEQVNELGWPVSAPAPDPRGGAKAAQRTYEAIHRALLAGLLGNVGCGSDEGEHYLGLRGLEFHVHPASGIERKGAKWLLGAELVETTRLYARCVARIEPQWIEEAAGAQLRRSWHDPRWDPARGEVVAAERVTLHGLVLVPRRSVSYGAVAPVEARAVFLREALVPGALATRGAFLAHNRALLAEVAALEHKARRRDVLVDDQALYDFYDARVPGEVCSTRGFEAWRERAEAREPRLLFMTRETLIRDPAREPSEALFPATLALGGTRLPLAYRFEPGHPMDGLTLRVPLELLNQIDEARLTWLVPGMVREKVALLLRALPKPLRNRLQPLPETVTAFLEAHDRDPVSLPEALRSHLAGRLGESVPVEVLREVELPPHLVVNLRVVDASGEELAMGRDLRALRQALGQAARLTFAAGEPGIERGGIVAWDFGTLPETIAFDRGGRRLTGYPALVDEGASAALRLFDTPAAADQAMRGGVLRLLAIALAAQVRELARPSPELSRCALQLRAAGSAEALLADLVALTCDRAFLADDPLPRTAKEFEAQKARARARLPAVREAAVRLLRAIAEAHHALAQALGAAAAPQRTLAREIAGQRDRLIRPGFLRDTPWGQLGHLPRYLEALGLRLAKQPANPARDARHAAVVESFERRWAERAEALRRDGRVDPRLAAFRWQIEELKVSLFAQELRTPFPVSAKRLERAWTDLSR